MRWHRRLPSVIRWDEPDCPCGTPTRWKEHAESGSWLADAIGASEDNIIFGAGDLYVTIYGGRTRMIGTLLGRGLTFEQARAELKGVTLESVAITTCAAAAVRKKIERGELAERDFPLLLHCDDLINHGAQVNIPWDRFEEEYFG